MFHTAIHFHFVAVPAAAVVVVILINLNTAIYVLPIKLGKFVVCNKAKASNLSVNINSNMPKIM